LQFNSQVILNVSQQKQAPRRYNVTALATATAIQGAATLRNGSLWPFAVGGALLLERLSPE